MTELARQQHAETTAAVSRDSKRRKITALLAGGLVLGVGAAVTLAAWNDSEFASNTFTAGTFVFQGSTNGTDFSDHASQAGAASLSFSTGFDDLSPDDIVYAPYALRVTGSDASLTAQPPTVTGALSGDLTFDAVATTDFGCDSTAYAAGSSVPATITDGSTVNLCLRVTAASSIGQGESGVAVWQWDAVSQ